MKFLLSSFNNSIFKTLVLLSTIYMVPTLNGMGYEEKKSSFYENYLEEYVDYYVDYIATRPKKLKKYIRTHKYSISIIGILCLTRLVTKDGPETMPYTPQEGLQDIQQTSLISKAFWAKLAAWIDHVVIGFPGKKKGLTPVGSKLFVEGKEKIISSQRLSDGTNIQVIHYENICAYGLMGRAWGHFNATLDALKKISEALTVARSLDLIKTKITK